MKFTLPIQIRFAHCDPAGIVFYPRYFEFFNTVIEDWCEHGLGSSFREMHMQLGYGLPTAHVECSFLKPSELGEILQAQLSLTKVGNTSLHVEIALLGPDAVQRVLAKMVLVLMDMKTRKAISLPVSLRQKMMPYLKEVLGTEL
ncbi:acyl-CoA thioesterase [Solimicrobium silvestre]|uniref:Thioesterase superfamily n=1 Tax=Solimicrobium silvestre TaxID=2099400 RepID=A0A2S9GVL4_9BURK|nr:thioesterase family protein [Solimicrobium silvestre]PRC91754.1 Thioesterase superfamily [Solimicrobium silvestre]